jgi:phosphatidylethanolamine N-methyltransferase
MSKGFDVPPTCDNVKALFDPRQTHNVFDWLTLALIFGQFALFAYLFSKGTSQTIGTIKSYRTLFLVAFLFWRLGYNVGLGWLLKIQSDHGGVVQWLRNHRFLDYDKKDGVKHGGRMQWCFNVIKAKMASDYAPEVGT